MTESARYWARRRHLWFLAAMEATSKTRTRKHDLRFETAMMERRLASKRCRAAGRREANHD